MPRNRGIGDYIPARGEARVLAELKGSYGGKSMGYRRRGSFRRPWQRTYWQPIASELAEWANLSAAPSLAASVQPVDSSTSPEDADYSGRLLRFQGGLYVRLHPTSGVSPTTADASLAAYVFYAWMIQKVSGNYTLDTPADTDLSPSGDWVQMMRRKDLMRWGIVRLQPTEHYEFFQGLISTQDGGAIPYPSMQPNPRPLTRIPFPRLPRAGLKLDTAQNVLCCYTTVLQNDWNSQYSNGANGWLPQIFPLYRTLWAKA